KAEDAGASRPRDPNALLDALVRENLDAELAFSPTTATWLGVHAYDDRLDDVRLEPALVQENLRLLALVERLERIDDKELDPQHRIDHKLLTWRAQAGIFELRDVRAFERNPLAYVSLVAQGIYELLGADFGPLPDRLRALEGRLRRVRPLLDEA